MKDFDEVMALRLTEADRFYNELAPENLRNDKVRNASFPRCTLRHDVEQAIFLLRRRYPAARTQLLSYGWTRRKANAKFSLVPHVQRRHHFDAGQVGIPPVRRMGSQHSTFCQSIYSILTLPSRSWK